MKKFVFSLEKVLGFKKQSLDVLKNEMVALQSQIAAVEKKIEEIYAEFAALNQKLQERMQEGLQPMRIAVYKGYLEELDRQIRLLEQEKESLVQSIHIKKTQIIQMNSDISGLERLRDKQVRSYQAQSRKEQELLIEEFVSHAHTLSV